MNNNPIPLCVDLDGTLLNSDLLLEAALAQLKQAPLSVWQWPRWLAAGKARLKAEIADRVQLDIETLPYHLELLAFLREQKAQGRCLVLVTASHRRFADRVAEQLDLFDRVLATDSEHNLAGRRKAETLVELYGERGFDYAGNATVDLAVWRHARRALVVNAAPALMARASAVCEVERVFARPASPWRQWLRALRLYQWLKNVLIFMPLAAGHALNQPDKLLLGILAFLSFGLCASSAYLLNDLLDLSADRRHPRKRSRPFAAGQLPIAHGIAAVPLLLGMAFGLSLWVDSPYFSVILAGYYVFTLAYSLRLKRVLMLDTIVLAGLYTLRIMAGAAAVSILPSFWLLAFSMFLFLSLALVKRYSELWSLREQGELRASGRGYHVDDLNLLQNLGGAAGYLAVLVLALYVNSEASRALYEHPTVIWLLCPVLLYWISRVWLIAHRGEMHDDPIIFTLTDRHSRLMLLVCVLIVLCALPK
ncbi:MAG TPA: UbiA family prenyltransferase [Candidatus Competibacteraceae bacterium]|nr:UbiA family prenyltransferase [Candidatus Competibacteraceae bacterium]HQA26981.1 UbiA family prenyltransferase [Candidatus Competibacteraceae bacterium]HQD55263.1 UbiA family prenyltransferase [Candidatus Competibacteraceae bacterium]